MGRSARGVRGIKLRDSQQVISLIIPDADGVLLMASENGYGKRTPVDQFSVIGRGGQGVICMKRSERNGALVGVTDVGEGFEVILISDQGTLVRTRVDEVSSQGRNTQGVRLINLGEGEALVGLASFEEPDLDDALLSESDDEPDVEVDQSDVNDSDVNESDLNESEVEETEFLSEGEGPGPDDDLTEDDHDGA